MLNKLPPSDLRSAVAEAIHNAVVSVSGTTGRRLCMLYAHTAAIVARCITPDPPPYVVVIGSLGVQAAPSGAWITHTRESGDFHAWVAALHPNEQVELIDLTARHYRSAATELGATWKMAEPSPYIWCWASNLPNHVRLDPDPTAMKSAYEVAEVMNSTIQLVVNASLQSLDDGGIQLWRNGKPW